jgi:aminomethyltransferase
MMLERGTARHGYSIHKVEPSGAGPKVGLVTSGTLGPTVEKNIALGLVAIDSSEAGRQLYVDCRGKMVKAEIVKGPFYRCPKV